MPDKKFTEPVLPTDSEERKNIPLFSGCINYMPLALAALARLSKRGNDKHNQGQPLHHDRSKSGDHLDCVARHLVDAHTFNEELQEYEDAVAMFWRSGMFLQGLEEKRLGKQPARGSLKPEPETEPATPPASTEKFWGLFCIGGGQTFRSMDYPDSYANEQAAEHAAALCTSHSGRKYIARELP